MPDEKEIPKDPRKDQPQNRVQSDGDEKSLKPIIKKRKPKKK